MKPIKDFNKGELIIMLICWFTVLMALGVIGGCTYNSASEYVEPPFVDVWCEGKPPIYGDDC